MLGVERRTVLGLPWNRPSLMGRCARGDPAILLPHSTARPSRCGAAHAATAPSPSRPAWGQPQPAPRSTATSSIRPRRNTALQGTASDGGPASEFASTRPRRASALQGAVTAGGPASQVASTRPRRNKASQGTASGVASAKATATVVASIRRTNPNAPSIKGWRTP